MDNLFFEIFIGHWFLFINFSCPTVKWNLFLMNIPCDSSVEARDRLLESQKGLSKVKT